MRNIWFTSDTHAYQKNICIGSTDWIERGGSPDECRNFQNAEEMTDTLVENINKLVKAEDVLYHCGDWSFGGKLKIWEFRRRINCKEIHLVLGNHDQHIEQNAFSVIEGKLYGKPQDLFSSVQHYKEISVGIRPNKQKIILCHFPMRVWNHCDEGSWMLHGHCHGNLASYSKQPESLEEYMKSITQGDDLYKTMDIGMDTNFLEPYHYDEIDSIMKNRVDCMLDHHDGKSKRKQ